MATLKFYQYGNNIVKAFNKEDVRRKLHLPYTKLKVIKKVWCKSYKRGKDDIHNKQ
jgi:hypothetical protein